MTTRKERLRKLVKLQDQLKAMHETRHAGFVAGAIAAANEAAEIAQRFDMEGSLSALFPEIYHDRISRALAQQQAAERMAKEEAEKLATATARTNMVERAYRDEVRKDERDTADRERLDMIERRRAAGEER
jgi:hypothetical protein